MATREINIEGLVEGDFLKYDDESPSGDGEFVRQPAVEVAGVFPAAISGGEAPTEAEFLALRTRLLNLETALASFGAIKEASA